MQWISRNNHCVVRAILALSSAYQEYLMTWKLKTSLVVQRARPLRTYSLIILDILDTKKSNLIIVLLHIERKKWKSCFCFFTDGKQPKVREFDLTTRDLGCPWHDHCIICSYDVTGADFENSLYARGQPQNSYGATFLSSHFKAQTRSLYEKKNAV